MCGGRVLMTPSRHSFEHVQPVNSNERCQPKLNFISGLGLRSPGHGFISIMRSCRGWKVLTCCGGCDDQVGGSGDNLISNLGYDCRQVQVPLHQVRAARHSRDGQRTGVRGRELSRPSSRETASDTSLRRPIIRRVMVSQRGTSER